MSNHQSFFKEKFDIFLAFIENVIYSVIALFLVLTAFALLYMVINSFLHAFDAGELMEGFIHVIDNILLVLMVIEILYTIRVSIKEHTLCSEPFLIVGLIATIRRILIISVESAQVVKLPHFMNYMIEMAILGVLTILFVISIVLIKKQKQAKMQNIP